ncbi:hypothetical protein D3C78_939270 [compost metagenome]
MLDRQIVIVDAILFPIGLRRLFRKDSGLICFPFPREIFTFFTELCEHEPVFIQVNIVKYLQDTGQLLVGNILFDNHRVAESIYRSVSGRALLALKTDRRRGKKNFRIRILQNEIRRRTIEGEWHHPRRLNLHLCSAVFSGREFLPAFGTVKCGEFRID